MTDAGSALTSIQAALVQVTGLEIPQSRLKQTWESITSDQQTALGISAQRIRVYAEHQTQQPRSHTESACTGRIDA